MKRLIALASGDWHVHNSIPRYTGNALEVAIDKIKIMGKEATKYDVPILFTGDLCQNPDSLSNSTTKALIDLFTKKRFKIIGIDGNHDLNQRNSFENPTKGFFSHFAKIQKDASLQANYRVLDNSKTVIAGIPYYHYGLGFKEAIQYLREKVSKYPGFLSILLLHADLEGSVDTDGRRVMSESAVPTTLFEGFDIVLSGHIHKPQRLAPSIVVTGAIQHRRKSDMGCDMGYWRVYNDKSMEFVSLGGPNYRTYEPSTQVPDNTTDIWIPVEDKKEQATRVFPAKVIASKAKIVDEYFKNVLHNSDKKLKNKTINLLNTAE